MSQPSKADGFASPRQPRVPRDRDAHAALASVMPSGRVVVVMSTIPSRLGDLDVALDSIRAQTRVPDLIVLSLPQVSLREGTEYSVPTTLSSRESRGELAIIRTARDFGPGTKILGPLALVEADDIVVILDDDNWYEPFTVGELTNAITSGLDAASFAVYERRGVRVGQGADGFAMTGAAARMMQDIIPLLDEHRSVFLQDDYWMSFLLARAGVTIHDVSACLVELGKPHCYRALDLSNGLVDLEGADDRDEIIRRESKILFRYAAPTPAMRTRRAWAAMRAGGRKVRARVR